MCVHPTVLQTEVNYIIRSAPKTPETEEKLSGRIIKYVTRCFIVRQDIHSVGNHQESRKSQNSNLIGYC